MHVADVLNLEPWWRFGLALLIGALVGLEREFVQQQAGEPAFAGIRTFALMAMLGAVMAYMTQEQGLLLFGVGYAALALLVWASYLRGLFHGVQDGITTEVAALLVPLLGAMVVWGPAQLAAALGVVTALILSLKPRLHTIARTMSAQDLWATLEFALIAGVVLPILPDRAFDPYGVLNPYGIWRLVVFVSGIGFFGYVLMKVLGAERGIGLAGILGGVVSSTATTLSFAGRSRKNPTLAPAFGRAIILASAMMFPRVLLEVWFVHPPLVFQVLLPVGAMFLASLVVMFLLWKRESTRGEENEDLLELSNPLNLSIAIKFALLFVVVLLAVRVAERSFGETGVYVTSLITGLADVDAITLSVAELAAVGQIEHGVAAVAILIAVVVNTASKAALAVILGGPQLYPVILPAFGAMILAGVLSSLTLF